MNCHDLLMFSTARARNMSSGLILTVWGGREFWSSRRPPELADEAKRDLLAGPLAEQDPPALVHRDRWQIPEPHRLRRLRRPLAVEEVTDHLRQHPQSAEHPDQRRRAPQLQQVDIEQRLPSDLPIGLNHPGDRIGDVVNRQEVLGKFGFRHRGAAYAQRST